MTCNISGQTHRIGVGYSWFGGLDPALTGHDFDYADNRASDWRLHMTGHWDKTGASGTILIAYARLTPDLDAEVCSSGQLTWSATPGGIAAPASSEPEPDSTIQVHLDADGFRQVAVTDSDGRTSTQGPIAGIGSDLDNPFPRLGSARGQPRVAFAGRTSQNRRLSFRVSGTGLGKKVQYLVIGFRLKCDESHSESSFIIGGLFWNTPIAADGTFAAEENDGFFWARWDGTIHDIASGHIAGLAPQFLPASESDAEVCRSGDLTWVARRQR